MLTLLDYGKPNPFSGIIGRPRKLAWPVHAYRVTLPKISNDGDGLNAFERVILKLLDVFGILHADELADETRIPLDLVKGVLLRLQDKGFIDEYNAIIRQERNEGLNEEDNPPVFVTVLLFRELVTGKILPFLHQLDGANPLQKKEGEEKDFRTIRWDATHKRNTPTQRDVINTLRAMKKRAAVLGMEYKIPPVQQITIIADPEFYHLDCTIAIQKSDSEFRIADPFGNGFSLILEKSFEQMLELEDSLAGWLLAWKQLLSTSGLGKQDARPKEPFETDANRQHYPKLIASLKPASNAQFRTLAKIHASIEWALFYACCARPFKNVIATLKYTEQSQHAALLKQAAQTIGLEQPSQDFRPIREGKLMEFENGGAYQETVLAIAILQARNDEGHPLRRLPVKIGAGMKPYELSLGRNVLWTGTMNQDETTKSLSDKVLDRSIIINFPRPTELKRRLKLTPLDEKNRGPALHKASWQSWLVQRSNFQEEVVKPFKTFIENMNDALAISGRALGHRVWQSIEYYMANYPDVRAALAEKDDPATYKAMHIAFEDQLVQKVMPKLRGIDTRGKSKTECLDKIRGQIVAGINGNSFNLAEDFDLACELGYGQFIWQSANYLNADDAIGNDSGRRPCSIQDGHEEPPAMFQQNEPDLDKRRKAWNAKAPEQRGELRMKLEENARAGKIPTKQ